MWHLKVFYVFGTVSVRHYSRDSSQVYFSFCDIHVWLKNSELIIKILITKVVENLTIVTMTDSSDISPKSNQANYHVT